jgi:hypothetical protein
VRAASSPRAVAGHGALIQLPLSRGVELKQESVAADAQVARPLSVDAEPLSTTCF